jgi:hypothetical protein
VKWSFQKAIKAKNNNKYKTKKNESEFEATESFLEWVCGGETFLRP